MDMDVRYGKLHKMSPQNPWELQARQVKLTKKN